MKDGRKVKFNLSQGIIRGQGAFSVVKPNDHLRVRQSPFQKQQPKFDPTPKAVKPLKAKRSFGRDSVTTPVRSPKIRSY
jgi:hypothetical protein